MSAHPSLPPSKSFLGIDGCHSGWIGVTINNKAEFEQVHFWQDTSEMMAQVSLAALALIDIPIGLPDPPQSRRPCDVEARKLLGPRRSSVFLPALRCALQKTSYSAASQANHRACGKKFSIQMWNILPRIKAVDRIIRSRPRLQRVLRESHPEICFWALSGGKPVMESKKTVAGMRRRLRLVSRHTSNSREFFNSAQRSWPRAQVAIDDVLDAMALALTAMQGSLAGLVSLPSSPSRDSQGLRMEIVYCKWSATMS